MPPMRLAPSTSSALTGPPPRRVQPTSTPVPSTMETINVPSRTPSPTELVPAMSAPLASSSHQNPNEASMPSADEMRDP
eukprot:8123156-Karenia_brevis.AAC.1